MGKESLERSKIGDLMSNDTIEVIRKVLENAPVEKILEYRDAVLRIYNDQMALIAELLKKKEYVEPDETNQDRSIPE